MGRIVPRKLAVNKIKFKSRWYLINNLRTDFYNKKASASHSIADD